MRGFGLWFGGHREHHRGTPARVDLFNCFGEKRLILCPAIGVDDIHGNDADTEGGQRSQNRSGRGVFSILGKAPGDVGIHAQLKEADGVVEW